MQVVTRQPGGIKLIGQWDIQRKYRQMRARRALLQIKDVPFEDQKGVITIDFVQQ